MFRLSCVALGAVVGAAVVGPAAADDAVIAKVKYTCDGDTWIEATYEADKVDLVLSDGRTLSVPQAMSGSGARYANADESFVFWNKGNDAFITEGDPDKPTFNNCVGQPS